MPRLGASDFLRIFRSRRDCSRSLLELSRRQRVLIRGDNYDQLFDVLAQKQSVLDRMGELGQSHTDLLPQWQAFRESAGQEVRHECEELLAEAETLLAELLQEESASTNELVERRNVTQQELMELSKNSRVHDAYRTALAPSTHRHLDVGQ